MRHELCITITLYFQKKGCNLGPAKRTFEKKWMDCACCSPFEDKVISGLSSANTASNAINAGKVDTNTIAVASAISKLVILNRRKD